METDGMITNVPGICLVTFYADCVPLYFVDPVHEVIGLAHSGWRGTVGQIGAQMIKQMRDHFGTRPEDIVAAIGPSICRECYEVSEDVAEVFMNLEQKKKSAIRILADSGIYIGLSEDSSADKIVTAGNVSGKYQLDLWLANAAILVDAGICPNKLSITDVCTCHNPEYLFSHRASQGKRGGLCAFLMLKES